jgi:voltage-dependent potassium channel beta subunit
MPNADSMQYRPLGRCGTKVSALGLGGWTTFGGSVTDEGTIRSILLRAFEAGINFFDIADVYARGESERAMGKVLAELPRHELVITTKLFWPMSDDVNDRGLSRKHVMESVEKSLKRIGTDYLDVYFCHRHDPETPTDETLRAMDDLIRQGKVLYWGTSEWTGDQMREAHELAGRLYHAPRVEQPQYSLLARGKVEEDVQPAAEELGMGLVVWSPLASGLLTGKYDDEVPEGTRLARIDWLRDQVRTPEKLAAVRAMQAVADDLGCSRTQLALAWCAAQPGVSSVILGATRPEQLEENLGAMEVRVDDDVRARLDAIFPRA